MDVKTSFKENRSISSPGRPEASSEEPRFSDTQSTTSLSPKGDAMAVDANQSATKLTKRESYKAQRKHYRYEKKRVASELWSTLTDPSMVVLADWLKVRGSLKGWTKLWCVLKPGLLLLYKSPKINKSSQWVGTVLLNACELIERPSKKDGFCFKIFHPLEQSIWASKGPRNETIGALVQPLPVSHLIFRAPSEAAGKCWMDALELSLRCSSLLMRSMTGGVREGGTARTPVSTHEEEDDETHPLPLGISASERLSESGTIHDVEGEPRMQSSSTQHIWNESDLENHFRDHDLGDDTHTDDQREHDNDGVQSLRSTDTDSEEETHGPSKEDSDDDIPLESPYLENDHEEFGQAGGAGQTEEVAEENRSLIWSLVKQVRPGMDLSKVVLPTFILEPRSFLDKLADYYYHADILSKAVQEDDPLTRMKMVVQWYLSGFYKKPKGLKKPYNPILGEIFRCYWLHPNTGSRTFYLAEQVSHHPPISAFYVTNRPDGFCISGTILAKSKFYGNSLSAILDGTARLTFLTRGETYAITMPYAHCKGILMGTLTMELGGKVDIICEKTGYRTELEFKLKPFLGGAELCNLVVGKVKLGKETLLTFDGHWDSEIFIRDKRTGEEHLFWNPTPEIRSQRLKRYTVPVELQEEFESERMWQHVSAAILKSDQVAATEEKTLLEEAQRKGAKERQARMEKWMPRFFVQDLLLGDFIYKHADSRPWDPRNDVVQFESGCIIQTKTRHRTPIVPSGGSLVSVEGSPPEARHPLLHHVLVGQPPAHSQSKKKKKKKASGTTGVASVMPRTSVVSHVSGSSSADAAVPCDSTESEAPAEDATVPCSTPRATGSLKGHPSSQAKQVAAITQALQPLQKAITDTSATLLTVQRHLESVMAHQRHIEQQLAQRNDLTTVAAVVLVQLVIHWIVWVWSS
ncbi:oxysterol-binding protein-related protein 8-like isoform X2 [Ornithodoros turicata]|uniref:oxysterol-binding protein-related protein 8-like isoform X2 n=1 Tax=Ornithodoros turicata TaxID=34597 RepID=UPI003138F8D8